MNKVDWTKPLEMFAEEKPEKTWGAHYIGQKTNGTYLVESLGSNLTYVCNAFGQALSGYQIRNKVETKEVQVDVGVFINAAGTVFPRLVCGGGGEGALRNSIAKTDEKLLHTFSAKIIVAK